MKNLLNPFLAILILSGYSVSAQKDTTLVYFDSLHNRVTMKNASRIGKVVRKNDLWFMTLYKVNTGDKVMSGSYSDRDLEMEEGLFEYFDDYHSIIKGAFHEGKQDGVWKKWDKDGLLTDSVFFNEGNMVSDAKYQYHVNGHLWRYSLETEKKQKLTRIYDSADVLISEGRFIDNDGEMFMYYANGKIKSHSVFKDGKRTIYDLYDEKGQKP